MCSAQLRKDLKEAANGTVTLPAVRRSAKLIRVARTARNNNRSDDDVGANLHDRVALLVRLISIPRLASESLRGPEASHDERRR